MPKETASAPDFVVAQLFQLCAPTNDQSQAGRTFVQNGPPPVPCRGGSISAQLKNCYCIRAGISLIAFGVLIKPGKHDVLIVP